jgi:hypothetical protein
MHTIYAMRWFHMVAGNTGQFLFVFRVFGVQIIINDLQLLTN